MFSNFACFKDLNFDHFNEQANELQYGKCMASTQYDEKQIIDPTAEGDLFGHLDLISSKNVPVDVRDYEISFESTFLQQHKNALKYETENFVESSMQQFYGKQMKFACEQFLGKHLQFSSLPIQKSQLSTTNQMKLFLTSISKHQKLNNFFDFLYESYSKEISNEFMYLASLAYNKHIETKNDEEDQTSLLLKAKLFSQSKLEILFHGERINFLNLRNKQNINQKSKETVKVAFQRLVEFFFATIMLITDEYFINPFAQNENFKRNRSFYLNDDSEEKEYKNGQNWITGTGVKKWH